MLNANSSLMGKLRRVKMSIEISIEGEGLVDIETLVIPKGSKARDVIAGIAKKSNLPLEAAFLFEEDSEEPLDLDLIIDEHRAKSTVHHVHTAKKIAVVIYYNNKQIEHRFPPSTRVHRVLLWATGREGFSIDPAIAPEMELALHGKTEALPRNAHIGRFVKHGHTLVLDLIRGVVPNGW
jgi:hypothetical protein